MTLEQRIQKLEKTVAEIRTLLNGAGETRDDGVDMYAYQRAIRELAGGNMKPLEIYMKRGGKIPVNREAKG